MRHKTNSRTNWSRLSAALLLTACTLQGTADPPMPVENFDPSKALEAARAHAGPSSELLEFEARYVRPDGTMDLTAPYHPSLEYTFIRRNPDAEPVPAGAPSEAFERIDVTVNEPQWVNVKSTGGCSGTFRDRGMRRRAIAHGAQYEFDERTAAPSCSLADVWAAARKQVEIPKDAVAQIEFDRAGYEFRIYDLNVHLRFTASCERID